VKRALARGLDALGGALPGRRRPVEWAGVRRVAVLRLDHLGDLLLSFPALEALRSALPQARIDLFVGPWCLELARLCPSVDSVQALPAEWFQRPGRQAWPWASLWRSARALRRGGYDLGVDLRGELRHALLLRLAGIPQRLGALQTAGSFLLTQSLPPAQGHEAQRAYSLLREAGLPGLRARAPQARLDPGPAARARARARLKAWGLKPGFLAVHPFAGSPSRRWPREHWRDLLGRLPGRGRVLLLGSADEAAALRDLLPAGARGRYVGGAGDLGVAELAAVLQQAGLLLGLNSGPGHLAAAVGTPVLSLFSAANDPARWAPRGPGVRVLMERAPCGPCELAECPLGNACLRRLRPDRVLAALKAGA
jgi:ADP-heptose:LPS heptosyltransferase